MKQRPRDKYWSCSYIAGASIFFIELALDHYILDIFVLVTYVATFSLLVNNFSKLVNIFSTLVNTFSTLVDTFSTLVNTFSILVIEDIMMLMI